MNPSGRGEKQREHKGKRNPCPQRFSWRHGGRQPSRQETETMQEKVVC